MHRLVQISTAYTYALANPRGDVANFQAPETASNFFWKQQGCRLLCLELEWPKEDDQLAALFPGIFAQVIR